MSKDATKEVNGYSTKEILAQFVLPEIRDLNDRFDEFLEKDYKPFKETTNRWRWTLTGSFLFVTVAITVLGTLSVILGNLDVI